MGGKTKGIKEENLFFARKPALGLRLRPFRA